MLRHLFSPKGCYAFPGAQEDIPPMDEDALENLRAGESHLISRVCLTSTPTPARAKELFEQAQSDSLLPHLVAIGEESLHGAIRMLTNHMSLAVRLHSRSVGTRRGEIQLLLSASETPTSG